MKSFNLIILCIIFFIPQGLNAQVGLGMPLVDTYKMAQHAISKRNKTTSPEDRIEKVQAFFIQKVFLNPFFKLQQNSLFSEDDKNSDFQVMAANTEFMNEIVTQELAKKLAKQDIFKLKKKLLKDYNKIANNSNRR